MTYSERNFEEHIEKFLKSKNFNSYSSEQNYNKKKLFNSKRYPFFY